ncbi:MAG: hypothetical protein GY862_20295 [Gammaproteobacteria bacterium]|nr:hypothetical protein [Gammaproteobacteria bacterium]
MSPEEAKTLVFKYWNYLNSLAKKRFSQNAAEQAVSYMLEKLEKNQWQRVREYEGRGFSAFIGVVANRLFIDFARKSGETHPTVSMDSETIDEPVSSQLPPVELLNEIQTARIFEVIFSEIISLRGEEKLMDRGSEIRKWIQRVRPHIALKDEEYLLLAMIYRDGSTVSEAGRRLGLSIHQAQGRHRRLLARLRKAFEHCGLAEDIRILLE